MNNLQILMFLVLKLRSSEVGAVGCGHVGVIAEHSRDRGLDGGVDGGRSCWRPVEVVVVHHGCRWSGRGCRRMDEALVVPHARSP